MHKTRSTFVERFRPWLILLVILAVLIIWQLIIVIVQPPHFLLPSPLRVFDEFRQSLFEGSLLYHTGITLFEVVVGLLMGSTLAVFLGYLLGKSPILEGLLSPFLVASQAIPLVAIAPLLVIWFGPGLLSKILICALIVFFPILVNTIVGVKAVPRNLRDLMQSMKATQWQTLRYLELPAALPVILGGLRVGATLSVVGAVVGEFLGADRGLGFLINVARGQFDTAMVFVAVFTLILMALGLYGLVLLLEKRFLSWKRTF